MAATTTDDSNPLPPISAAERDDIDVFVEEMQTYLADLYANIDQMRRCRWHFVIIYYFLINYGCID